jgi:outer membrane receptor protein involved in Fe transport
MTKNTISKVLMATALGTFAITGSSLIEDQSARAQGSATVGSLRGVIRDKAGGEPAVGATVVATSPALQGEQVVITDENGQYFITSLPSGVYTLTVYYNDNTFSRGNVLIQLGKEAVVNVTVDTGAATGKPKGEVINIQGTAPLVDQGSTKTGITVTDDYTRNIPTARTFGGVVGAAAGAQGDFYGISLSGATSLENIYIVEGINTTDTAFGELSSNLPNEFISETEVITGGYNAEYGRSTGGIVNVVTKQGSNELRGSVFGYYRPGALVSDAEVINREGSSVDSKTDLDYQYDLGAELGGPIIKDKLWFHVGFNPSVNHRTTSRIVQRQIDKNQDGIPDVDPVTGFTVQEELGSSPIPRDNKTYYFTAKINGAVDQNNQFQISAFGNPSGRKDTLEHSSPLIRNPEQTRWQVDEGAYDFAGKWTSKFGQGKTQIDAVLGYHRGYRNEHPTINGMQDTPFVFYNYERSLYDFNDLEMKVGDISGCEDSTTGVATANDPYPLIRNCPVFGYAEGGLSFVEERTNARTSGQISLTQRVKAAGYHVFKAGLDGDFAGYDHKSYYTAAQRWRRSANTATGAPGRWQLREFYTIRRNVTDPATEMLAADEVLCANDQAVCGAAESKTADTLNRTIAAYAQDSWQLKPNFTLNLGVRYEQQIGYVADEIQGSTSPEGEIVPEKAYTLNNWAPRLGFIFDPTREGKSKIFGHYGRFYENVPMDINVRAFGGEMINLQVVNLNRRTPTAGAYDPNCDLDHTPGLTGAQMADRLNMCQDRLQQATLGGGYEFVSPGLRGQRTDEIIFGTEYEIVPDLTVGADYMHRTMPSVIEDISTDGGNTYLITNPGQNFDSEAEELMRQADQLMASTDPKDQALGELYAHRADQLLYVKEYEKPVRNYDSLTVRAKQRPTRNSLLQASYTYSKSKGNYPGLFSTETLQEDPNLTSLYDLPELMANRYGFMGLDRPHNLKVDGFYAFDFKKAGALIAGASWRTQSGIPHNALGAHIAYGASEAYLLPRGSGVRSPVQSAADVHLSYRYSVNKNTAIEAFVNIFNLFNQQGELDQDETYTYDAATPIIGGTPEDLMHIKALDITTGLETNTTVTKNKNFGNTNVRTSPRNIQLGFRLTF